MSDSLHVRSRCPPFISRRGGDHVLHDSAARVPPPSIRGSTVGAVSRIVQTKAS